ncbi:MAG: hypothetical protein L6V91_10440 [Bacilli bacterium]|nr:MAG: hypothetical protein L6V91_10440 [Bacilli bacterium]
MKEKQRYLKRLTDNYYTIEKLRDYYEKDNNSKERAITQKIITSSQRQTQNKMRKIIKNINSENNALLFLKKLKDLFDGRIINEIKDADEVYTLEIATLFNKMNLIKFKNNYLLMI